MRILMLCYEYPPIGGGGSKVVDGLTKNLANQGHEVDLVTTRFSGARTFEQKGALTIRRVHSWRRRADRSNSIELATYVIMAFFAALRLVRSKQYDICHAHFILPDGLVARLLRFFTGAEFIITAHGSDVPGYNPDRFIAVHKILKPLWSWVTTGTHCVICPSHSLRSLILVQNPDIPTTIIPNGFEPRLFQQRLARKPVILAVTRLFERKGVQHLIAAIADLDEPFECHIVGDGPYSATLIEAARGSRMLIKFHGWVENDSETLKELLATASVFVLASEAENFPISILEAMSAGLPIVTTSGTGCAEVIGDAGILVPPKDPAALRQAVLKLMHDDVLREKLSVEAYKRLNDNFSWEAVTKQHVELYQKISLGPHNSGAEGNKTTIEDHRAVVNEENLN